MPLNVRDTHHEDRSKWDALVTNPLARPGDEITEDDADAQHEWDLVLEQVRQKAWSSARARATRAPRLVLAVVLVVVVVVFRDRLGDSIMWRSSLAVGSTRSR